MEFTDQDKQMLVSVHNVFYKARLIDSPELANLGLQFTQFMQKVTNQQREPMLKNKEAKPDGGK